MKAQIIKDSAETMGMVNFVQLDQVYQLSLMSCTSGWHCLSAETVNKTLNSIANNLINLCNTTVIDLSHRKYNFSRSIMCDLVTWKHRFVQNNLTYQLQSNKNISTIVFECVKSQIEKEKICTLADWRAIFIIIGILIFVLFVSGILAAKRQKNSSDRLNYQSDFFKNISRINPQNEKSQLVPVIQEPAENEETGLTLV